MQGRVFEILSDSSCDRKFSMNCLFRFGDIFHNIMNDCESINLTEEKFAVVVGS